MIQSAPRTGAHLVIAMEQRFVRAPSGGVLTEAMYPWEFWQRYLTRFERVTVLARVHDVSEVSPSARRVDGEGVSVWALPGFVGPVQLALSMREVRRELKALVDRHQASCFVLRVPGTIGSMLAPMLRHRNIPYGVEVVGDPHDVFAPGANEHPLRAVWRLLGRRSLQGTCRHASAAIYVTERALQQRYPTDGISFAASDVELADSDFITRQPTARELLARPYQLVTVGSLEQPYKGTRHLLEAIARLSTRGRKVRCLVVGEGRLRPQFEGFAGQLGIDSQVEFAGSVPSGVEIFKRLDLGTLFVLPSLMEGLPRALVEAMARALPAVGSRIGGIPELLPENALVEPGDIVGLADRVAFFLDDPDQLATHSAANLERAKQFDAAGLHEIRVAFLGSVLRSRAQANP